MSLSGEPARKLFIKQCSKLITDNNSEPSKRHKKWNYIKNKIVTVRLVWIQGVISHVSESYDAITLDDGTGVALITSPKDATGFGSWIHKGQYLMVIGEVLSFQPDIKIRAVKLTHILEPNAETIWILEVFDFWKFMDTS